MGSAQGIETTASGPGVDIGDPRDTSHEQRAIRSAPNLSCASESGTSDRSKTSGAHHANRGTAGLYPSTLSENNGLKAQASNCTESAVS